MRKIFDNIRLVIENSNASKVLYPSLILVMLLIGTLNFNSNLMGGMFDFYVDYKNIIQSNFDTSVAKRGLPTFPMWGYGWILVLTEERWLIFVLQNLAALVSIVSLNRVASRDFNKKTLFLFNFMLIASASWIAIHSTLSPYSFAISLQIISITLIIKSIQEKSINFTIAAGLAYGLMLNFRSDYILFVPFVLFVIFYTVKDNLFRLKMSSVFLIITFSMLIPWSMYAHKTTGHHMLTSTNAGHVFFIGLGNLPNNKWGVSEEDDDPVMRGLLFDHFGEPESSLSQRGDEFLKKQYIRMILEDPIEYSKKVIYSFVKANIQGIYVPEFYNQIETCKPNCKDVFKKDIKISFIESLKDGEKFIIYILTYLSIFVGIIVLLVGHILVFSSGKKLILEKSPLIIFGVGVIVYQLALNSFSFQMKLYSTYSYIWCLFIIAHFIFDRSQTQKKGRDN